MAGTAEVVTSMDKLPGATYQVLVPNEKGLESVLSLLAAHPDKPPIDEIAVFTAATDAFSLANTNVTVADSLKRLARVVQGALDKGIRVRGYVSVVITCPYGGKVDYKNVRDVTRELLDMGCYEVSLGDTTGMGNPTSVGEMLDVTLGANPVEKLAGHVRSPSTCAAAVPLLQTKRHGRTFSSTILSAWEWPIPWPHSPRASAPWIVPSAGSGDAHTHRVRWEMWPRKMSCTRCKIPLTLRRETSRRWWTSAFGYRKSWGVIILVEWPRPFVHVENEIQRDCDLPYSAVLYSAVSDERR
jgi:hypothetical protein